MADEITVLVADQIRKWKMVEELNADPVFAHLFVRKAASIGRSNGITKATTHVSKVHRMPEKVNSNLRPRGYMSNAVETTLPRLPHEITTDDIERELKTTPGFVQGTKNINISINDALAILEKKGAVQRTKKRKGFRKVLRNMRSQQNSATESRTA